MKTINGSLFEMTLTCQERQNIVKWNKGELWLLSICYDKRNVAGILKRIVGSITRLKIVDQQKVIKMVIEFIVKYLKESLTLFENIVEDNLL